MDEIKELPPGVMRFPRTDNPFVTIFLVTRGRPHLLCQAVDSLYSLADRKDKLEFIFRADSDDLETVGVCTELTERLPNATLVVDQRGLGYVAIYQWLNRLWKLARGDWLMIFNDDATMQTEKWDKVLENVFVKYWHQCPDIAYIHAPTVDRHEHIFEFFFLRRRVLEVLGRWALSPHADNWIWRVMSQVGSAATFPLIKVKHISDVLDDQTRRESAAAYGEGSVAKQTLESEWAQKAMEEDAELLRAYIKEYHKVHNLEYVP